MSSVDVDDPRQHLSRTHRGMLIRVLRLLLIHAVETAEPWDSFSCVGRTPPTSRDGGLDHAALKLPALRMFLPTSGWRSFTSASSAIGRHPEMHHVRGCTMYVDASCRCSVEPQDVQRYPRQARDLSSIVFRRSASHAQVSSVTTRTQHASCEH